MQQSQIERQIKHVKDRKKALEKTDNIPQDIQEHLKYFEDTSKEAALRVYDRTLDLLEIEKTKVIRPLDSMKEGSVELNDLAQRLLTEDFFKLYVWAIEQVHPVSREILKKTKGTWIKYDQDSDHRNLVHSLEGHHTDWCTAKEGTARMHLKRGDFYVFYSEDEEGKARIPRVAIRMQEDELKEVRGVGSQQNLDPFIIETVEEKLKSFSDGTYYEKKFKGVKGLRTIDEKIECGEKLNKEDLIFLYELDDTIEGFGEVENSEARWHDPHIAELLKTRDVEADMQTIFECKKEQIARSMDQITQQTEAYVGSLEPGLFDRLPQDVVHLYVAFPEKKIPLSIVRKERKSIGEMTEALQNKNITISSEAMQSLEISEFAQEKTEEAYVLSLTLADLGFSERTTADNVFMRARELGLDFCSSETAFSYFLEEEFHHLKDEPIFIPTHNLSKESSDPSSLFQLEFYRQQFLVDINPIRSSEKFSPKDVFVFRRKNKTNTSP
ncbi:hypothetical protein HYV70_03010 [Candidatus Uhrbacteria bacterium]|nr:hypothetical protein [Candidatus Uhrbacteria bacterium]